MKIYLFLENRVKVFMLPELISGSYNFDEFEDTEDKLINIDSRNNKWILYSTEESKVLNNNEIIKEVPLQYYGFYKLFRKGKYYIIYTEKLIEDKINTFLYDDNINLVVGPTPECTLLYNYSFDTNKLFQINKEDGYLVLTIFTKNKVYRNGLRVYEEKTRLQSGDCINYYGLKMLLINNKLLINNTDESVKINGMASGLVKDTTNATTELEQRQFQDRDLYEKDNYFSKSPRMRRLIETKVIELTEPPSMENSKGQSMLLTVGPMFTMGLTSLVTLANVGQMLYSGEQTLSKVWPQLASALVMIISSLLWPLIAKKIEATLAKKNKKETFAKYKYYLNQKRKELDIERKIQGDILYENLLTVEQCLNIIVQKNMQLWDKRLDQSDFSVVRLGIGREKLDVDIEYPKEGFSIDENELKEEVDKLKEEYEYIENVPVGFSISDARITSIMGNIDKGYYFICNMLVQLLTFYSYEDLKIVVLTNENNSTRWDFIRYLMHSFTNDKRFRFFATDQENASVVMDYLNQELNMRLQTAPETPTPHYLIITDDYHSLKNNDFIKNFTETKEEDNIGMSMIILESRMNNLPSKCSHFINIGENTSGLLKNSYENQEQITFKDEINYSINMMDIVRILSNIPIEFTEGGEASLPETLTFLEMEKVGKVEQLNILSRWNSNSPTETLKAELGVTENGDLLYLDLHEKAHGPHGLIAGTTGSGKSEFIITYLLSMAINYSPDDVAYVLIDYKGGGLAFAFENKLTGVTLPHLAGTITNLDKAEMDRTLVSIDSESKRRQKIFNETRDLLGESTIDIYKYQRFYKEGKVKEPIPHLFIVCDEFAELKSQQPDFMDNLISIARIGRSLGIHLILATQKPSGVVTDQIWSNSKFHICLKVQDASDSNEMLKKPDAANLKQAGRFYLQVGYDEYYVLGQSAWCGAKYFPSEKIVKIIDKSVNFLADNGIVLKKIQASGAQSKKQEAQGEQLAAIMNEIINASKMSNKKARRLWLDNIPDIITIENTKTKYNFEYDKSKINFIVGEYDAPELQSQGIVEHSIISDGNTKIYSTESAEFEFLLKTMVYQLVKNYQSEDINIYIMDFGAQTLRVFEKTPHCGGYVILGEDEKYKNLIKLLKDTLTARKKILADYNGDYKNYLEKGNKDMPLDVIIINNYDAIKDSQTISPLDDLPDLMRDSERYGMVYFMTAASSPSIQMKINITFQKAYAYKLKDNYEYQEVLGAKLKNTPRQIFARGAINQDDIIHEFQTASIVEDEKTVNEFIENEIISIKENNKVKAITIPELPDQVLFKDVESKIKKLKNIPIGIKKDNVEVYRYNFTDYLTTIVCSNKLDNLKSFTKSLIQVLQKLDNTKLLVLDSEKVLEEVCKGSKNYYNDKLGDVAGGIANYFQEKRKENTVVIMYGFSKIKDQITAFDTLDILVKNMNNQDTDTALILIDSVNKFKDYMFEDWYKSSTSDKDGIYIGTGVGDQNTIKINNFNKEMNDSYPNNMGFAINEGVYKIVKFIEFEREKEEDDEDD